jgi:hypothetical protein
MYRGHSRRNCVGWCPRRLQEVEADLARLKVYIGVADGRYEADRRRRERICVGDVNIEEPAATWWVVRYGFIEARVGAVAEVEGAAMYLHMPSPPRLS